MSAAAPVKVIPVTPTTTNTNTPPPPPKPKAGDKIQVTNPNGLNIRSGAGTNNSVLGGLSQNEIATSIAVTGPYQSPNQMQDKQGNWWDLIQTSNGKSGWIEVQTASGQSYATDLSAPQSGPTPSPTGYTSAVYAPTPQAAAAYLLDQGNYSPYSRGQGKPQFDPTLQAQDFARTIYHYEQNSATSPSTIRQLLAAMPPDKAAGLFVNAAGLPAYLTTTGSGTQRFNVPAALSAALSVPGVLGNSSVPTSLVSQLVQQSTTTPANAKNFSLVIDNVTGTSTEATSLRHDFVNALTQPGKALGPANGTLSGYLNMRTYARAALRVFNVDPTTALTPQVKQELNTIAQFDPNSYKAGWAVGYNALNHSAFMLAGKENASWLAGLLNGAGPTKFLEWALAPYTQTNTPSKLLADLHASGAPFSGAFPFLSPSYLNTLVSMAGGNDMYAVPLANMISGMGLGQHRLASGLLAHLTGNPHRSSVASLVLLSGVAGLNPGQANQALTNLLLDNNLQKNLLWPNGGYSTIGSQPLPLPAAQLLAKAVANYGGGPSGLLNYLTNTVNYTMSVQGNSLDSGGLALARLFEDTLFGPHAPTNSPQTAAMMDTVGAFTAHLRKDTLHAWLTSGRIDMNQASPGQLVNLEVSLANGYGMAFQQTAANAQANAQTRRQLVTNILNAASFLTPFIPLGSILQDMNRLGQKPSNTLRGELNHGPIGLSQLASMLSPLFVGNFNPSALHMSDLSSAIKNLLVGFHAESTAIAQHTPDALAALNHAMGFDGTVSSFNRNDVYAPITMAQYDAFYNRYYANGTQGQAYSSVNSDPISSALLKVFTYIMSQGSNPFTALSG